MIPPELPFSFNADGTINDLYGNPIGQFKDHQHAEYVCEVLNLVQEYADGPTSLNNIFEEWNEIDGKVERLESKIEHLQEENKDLNELVEQLRSRGK